MIVYTQAQTEKEIKEILALQTQNLPRNLSQVEIEKEGFLTVEHDFDLLWAMNNDFPHTIAKHNGNIAGYALSMPPKFGQHIPVLQSLFQKVEELLPQSLRYIVMGQICIAKSHRGQGLFRGLYDRMRYFTQDRFDIIITEVDTRNTRSMQAHKAIGFIELSRYPSEGRVWSLIALK